MTWGTHVCIGCGVRFYTKRIYEKESYQTYKGWTTRYVSIGWRCTKCGRVEWD